MLPQVGRAHTSGGGHRLAAVGVRHHSGLNGHAKYTMPESMAYPNSFQEDYTNEEGVQPMFSKPHIREVQGPDPTDFSAVQLAQPDAITGINAQVITPGAGIKQGIDTLKHGGEMRGSPYIKPHEHLAAYPVGNNIHHQFEFDRGEFDGPAYLMGATHTEAASPGAIPGQFHPISESYTVLSPGAAIAH